MSITTDVGLPDASAAAAARSARLERWHTRINRSAGFFELVGFGWLVPLFRMAAGDSIRSADQGIMAPAIRAADCDRAVSRRLGLARAEGQYQSRRPARSRAGLGAGGQSVGRSHRRARKGTHLQRAAGKAQRRHPRPRSECRSPYAPLYRQADLHRPDFHQPEDRVRGLSDCIDHRDSARHSVRPVSRRSMPRSIRWSRYSSRSRRSPGCRSSPWW